MIRRGVVYTDHGEIQTPCFCPVGTKATVKSLITEDIKKTKSQVVLSNTYHLFLQPGDYLIKDMGGIHNFMNWDGPILTDSGGFQVFSLGAAYGKNISKVARNNNDILQIEQRSNDQDGIAKLANIGNDGVSFRSHLNGDLHYITPERSIEIQHNLGSDIIFAFDECTSPQETYDYQKESLTRTHNWAKRSLLKHEFLLKEKINEHNIYLFGVVQGARYEDLRKESAHILSTMKTEEGKGFDGFGIGGSFAKDDMMGPVFWVNNILPEDKPRHLLGIGEIEDIFTAVQYGVDMFDCVIPTRNARNGSLITSRGKLNIMNSSFINNKNSIDDFCECYTCKNYSLAYVAHLFRAKEMLGQTLATIHNLYFMNNLMEKIRDSIEKNKFFELRDSILYNYTKKSII